MTLDELWREYHYAKAATEALPAWKRAILQRQYEIEVKLGYIQERGSKR